MAIHYRTQGIFLKKSARGESDELFTVYTKDFGKLKILGRAIRKITSKLKGGTALFYLSEIEFIQGKNQKILTDAILIDKFDNIRKNLTRLRSAHEIAQILDALIMKDEKDKDVWQLLEEVFKKLNSLKKTEIICHYFFWHLVSILGYRPDISACSIGGKKIDCDIIKILKLILKKDWQILSRLKLEPMHLKLLKNTSEWYNDIIIKSNEK